MPGGPGGSGTLSLQVTDAAFEYDIVQSATVSVDKITIYHDSDSDSGPIVLYQGAPILLDLFHLRDGLTQPLDPSTLPAGSYHQLRLRVTDADLLLTNGNHYTTADHTIHLTSQGTSGFKVNFDPPIVIEAGETSNVLLDFDLTHTFHPIPANDALTATHYSLHPVIHVVTMGHVGGISGTVTQLDGSGGLVPVEAATVYVLPPGQTDPTLAVASTGTSASGTYSLLGLMPGTYDVLAVKADLSALAPGITVVSGEVAQVDLTLNDGTGGVLGTITQDDGQGGLMPVEGATVYVLPPGQTDVSLAVASGPTSATGAYLLSGIAAGTYDVFVIKDTLHALAPGIAISAGANTQVDLTLH
jgi:hypothetical protein